MTRGGKISCGGPQRCSSQESEGLEEKLGVRCVVGVRCVEAFPYSALTTSLLPRVRCYENFISTPVSGPQFQPNYQVMASVNAVSTAPVTAGAPFHGPKADVILHTSDNVYFYARISFY